jgi:FKBP-type peptidyl-prolyl cis-trans isomerase
LIALSCVLLCAPVALHAQREKLPPDDIDIVESRWPQAQKTFTGLRYVVEEPGKGPVINAGDVIGVTYIGSLLNGKVFDRSLNPLAPFTFRVGRGFVIEGWDQILQMMSVGSKWLVIIPPELGYGRKGSPPRIPGDATLVFEIKIVTVEREK